MTLKARLGELHAERLISFAPADLQVNIDQRAELVAAFDASAAVQPGDLLDPYSFEDVRGGHLALDDLIADGPAVLVFFRHAGCPACNVALPYYGNELAPGLAELGVRLVAVSPQVPERLVEIADRHALPFSVATDRENALARRLGVAFESNEASKRQALSNGADLAAILGTGAWELPMPAVIVLDRGRVVQFADVTPDWMARTDAEPVLCVVRELVRSHADTRVPATA
jgi:peroxiredoxin